MRNPFYNPLLYLTQRPVPETLLGSKVICTNIFTTLRFYNTPDLIAKQN
jgi:hypothetical protein